MTTLQECERLAERLGVIARSHGWDYQPNNYSSGILVRLVSHDKGVTCFVDLTSMAMPAYIVSWASTKRRLRAAFAQCLYKGGWRAGSRCFSGQGVVMVVEHGIRQVNSGAAFEPSPATLINSNAI